MCRNTYSLLPPFESLPLNILNRSDCWVKGVLLLIFLYGLVIPIGAIGTIINLPGGYLNDCRPVRPLYGMKLNSILCILALPFLTLGSTLLCEPFCFSVFCGNSKSQSIHYFIYWMIKRTAFVNLPLSIFMALIHLHPVICPNPSLEISHGYHLCVYIGTHCPESVSVKSRIQN